MKVQLQIDGSPVQAAASAAEIAATGADGLFTFEGQHDVFFPLMIAAAATTGLDLMTNVAIAAPRSPLHLAHAAYDLQPYSGGRFRLGLGSQIKVHIEKRYGSSWDTARGADGRDRRGDQGDLRGLGRPGAAWTFAGEFYTAHLDGAQLQPRPQPVRAAAGAAGRAGSGDDPHRRRGRRRAAGDAVQQRPPLRRTHRCPRSTRDCAAPGGRAATSRSSPRRWWRSAATRPIWRPRSTGWRADRVLRLDPGVCAGAGGRGLGRCAARAQRAVQARPLRRDARADHRRDGRTGSAIVGTPEECAQQIGRAVRRPRRRGVLLLPGYTPPPADIADSDRRAAPVPALR